MSTPVISHPRSQMGSCGDLSVRGVSTPVMRREKTISFVDRGMIDGVTRENRFYINDEQPRRLLHWPLDYQQGPGVRHVKPRQSPNIKGIPGDELIDKVRDKLTTGFYGVRHMFKANDPLGKGNITRDALLRVIHNLCGYITKDQFERFLERLDLENHNLISFNDFIRCFQDNETVRRQWIIPNQKLETQELRRAMYPEENLRNLENMYCDPYHSAPYAAAFIRDKLNTGSVNIRDILPSACFQPSGMILAPQLREALAQLDVHLTSVEFDKFWSRFDRDNCGAIYTKQFYKLIGLTSIGQPKITSTAITTSSSRKNTSLQKQKSEIVTSWSTQEKDGVLHDIIKTSYNFDVEDEKIDETQETKVKHQRTNEPKDRKVKKQIMSKPPVPPSKVPSTETSSVQISQNMSRRTEHNVENVINTLYSKYEQPHNLMLEGFELFDYLDDGYISKIDFRRVLKEFGVPIAALELEDFLNSCGIRTIRGQINYKDFLKKYCNQGNIGSLNEIPFNNKQVFQQEVKTEKTNSTKTERIESSVMQHLHGDFQKLVKEFRQVDTTNVGKVSKETFRKVIENQLGGTLTEKQWKVLQNDVVVEENGFISYPGFLTKFGNQIRPEQWNTQEYGITQDKTRQPSDEVIDKLRHMASYMMKVKDNDELDDRNKLLYDIHRKIEDILRSRFHTFDKHYKDMDRKMTGRMTKWQFGALLRLTGVILEQSELDRLWGTLKLAPDGMLSYCSLIQQFNPACQVRTAWGASTAPYALENDQDFKEKNKQLQIEKRGITMLRPKSAPMPPRPDSAKRPFNFKTDTSKLVKRKEIMQKLVPVISKNWEKLQQHFVRLDKQGYSNIGYMEMRGIMTQLQFGLTNIEMTEILDQFDLQGNGRFHYITFLEAFYPQNGDFEFVQAANELNPGFLRKLLREWQNLRRAFIKMDSSNDGYLDATDFRKCLKLCNIDGSDEDLYQLFSEFDSHLTGKISYKEFLKTLLSVK